MLTKLRVLVGVLALFAGVGALRAEVTIKEEKGSYTVDAGAYTAVVADDGSMTSLLIGGEQFLDSAVDISRGTYFHQDAVQKLAVTAGKGNTLVASNDKAGMTYGFAADGMTWAATNKTAQPMRFFVIFPLGVEAMAGDNGEFNGMPVTLEWPGTTWFRGAAKLHMTGGSREWAWVAGHQVWEATLAAHETRTIKLDIGKATAQEMAKVKAINAPLVEKDLTVLSPRDYQVFQRQTAESGTMSVAGRVKVACDAGRFRVLGTKEEAGAWRDMAVDAGHRFRVDAPLPAGGWYRVEVQMLKDGKAVADVTVPHVGMGEVFLIAGQSNSTNSGSAGGLKVTSGLVSTFSGTDWRIADDPQPGVHDKSMGGSPWAAFGDALVARYKVPVGLASTGHGGTSITQWKKDSELFTWTTARMGELGVGGFRAMLWHQGESDVKMTTDAYAKGLTQIIWDFKEAAGWDFPVVVARVSYVSPQEPRFESTRDAQKLLWDRGIALEGPDTDLLTGDMRDRGGVGIHLSPKGLKAHGEMWAEKVGPLIDKGIK